MLSRQFPRCITCWDVLEEGDHLCYYADKDICMYIYFENIFGICDAVSANICRTWRMFQEL